MTESNFNARWALLLAGALACTGTWAQSSAVSPSAAASAAERAQKETDRTMYWIRVLADKPAPAKAAPKAVAAALAPPPRPASVKVATALPAPTRTSADVVNAAPASVVVAEPAVSIAAPAALAAPGDPAALSMGGAPSVGTSAGALAAPTLTPPEVDVAPPEPEEPDPGLLMTKSVDPDFPGFVVRRLRKGSVEVRFEVDPNGVVVDTSIVKTSHPSLNASAQDAVRQWRFKPTPKSHTALVDLAFDIDK